MTTDIIPFENFDSFPAVYGDDAFALNAAAEEFASAKFPVISIKSNHFHVKRDGSKTLITRIKAKPTDPDEPASYIDMVVLNLQKSKTFYLNGYTEGSEEKPDCVSSDGIRPDVGSKYPQSSSCALCPHNAWGSGKNDKGEATAGKACSDILRLAVASPAKLDDPFLLRVPPASLKNFGEASRWLSSKRTPLNAAVIRITFDTDKNGVLKFEPIGRLDPETFAKANAMRDNSLVNSIIGKTGGATAKAPAVAVASAADVKADDSKADTEAAAKKAKADEKADDSKADTEAAAKKAKADAKAKRLAAAKAALAAAEAEMEDDEPPAEPERPEVAASSTKVISSSDLDAELDALLS